MKLYTLPRNTRFKLIADTNVPPSAPVVHIDQEYILNSIDGMYSLCLDSNKNIVHIKASADVIPLESLEIIKENK